jgi:hypothetical protein
MTRWGKPPSQTWRTFLENRAKEIVSIDFFTVSTATFRVLFVFSIRRECLDHVIVLSEKPLRRLLRSYLGYDHRAGRATRPGRGPVRAAGRWAAPPVLPKGGPKLIPVRSMGGGG